MSPLRTHYAAEALREWANLLVMAAQPGRRPSVRLVRRLGRDAGVPRVEVDRVAAQIGAAS